LQERLLLRVQHIVHLRGILQGCTNLGLHKSTGHVVIKVHVLQAVILARMTIGDLARLIVLVMNFLQNLKQKEMIINIQGMNLLSLRLQLMSLRWTPLSQNYDFQTL
jgi:hypothetical protein